MENDMTTLLITLASMVLVSAVNDIPPEIISEVAKVAVQIIVGVIALYKLLKRGKR